MNRLCAAMLLATICLGLGCGGGAVENPEVFDEQTLQEIKDNDAAVEAAERQQ